MSVSGTLEGPTAKPEPQDKNGNECKIKMERSSEWTTNITQLKKLLRN